MPEAQDAPAACLLEMCLNHHPLAVPLTDRAPGTRRVGAPARGCQCRLSKATCAHVTPPPPPHMPGRTLGCPEGGKPQPRPEDSAPCQPWGCRELPPQNSQWGLEPGPWVTARTTTHRPLRSRHRAALLSEAALWGRGLLLEGVLLAQGCAGQRARGLPGGLKQRQPLVCLR